MRGSNHRTNDVSIMFSGSTLCISGIAVIFLLLLLPTTSSLSAKYNIYASPFQVLAKKPINTVNGFIKNIVNTMPSNSNDSYTPFTVNKALPPRIVIVYNGTEHSGVLVDYKYRKGYTFGQLDIPAKNVTSLHHPSDVFNIKKGSTVQFIAKGNPAILPPNTLSIDAYTSQGKAVGVLNMTKGTSSTVALDLVEGKYILLATATWIPGSEHVTGYAIFSYMIDIIQ